MKIDLTRIERQILSNQNKILGFLDEVNRDMYDINVEILEKGFEGEYYHVINVYPDTEVKTYDICNETVAILLMIRRIENAIARLGLTESICPGLNNIRFDGFDANQDPHYYYAIFLITKLGKWQDYKGQDINSHSGFSINRYRRMLNAMGDINGNTKSYLSKEDIEYIINAVKGK